MSVSGWATVMGEVLRLGTTAAHYAYRTERSNRENHLIGVLIVCLYDDRKGELASAAASTCTNDSGAQY